MRIGRTSRRVSIAIQVAIAYLMVSAPACDGETFSLKWAMDDERYAEQYSVPYSNDPGTKRFQMIQEATDARFQEGAYGTYVGGGGALNHWSAGMAEVGVFGMPTSWSTIRLGGIGMGADGQAFAGAILDARIHAPTRFSPYAGLAGVAEFNHFAISHRYYNNYNNGSPPRRTLGIKGLAAIVPEAGVSYWISSQTRLNFGVGWYITYRGNPDFLMVNASVEFTTRDQGITPIPPPIPRYAEEGSDDYFMSYADPTNAELTDAGLPDSTPPIYDLAAVNNSSESADETELPVPRLAVPGVFTEESCQINESSVKDQVSWLDVLKDSTQKGTTGAPLSSENEPAGQWLRSRQAPPNP